MTAGHPFFRYLLAGLASLATDFSLYALLTHGAELDPLVANLVSRPIGGLVCYQLNRRFTFRSTEAVPGELARFTAVFLVSFGLTEVLLGLFCHVLTFGPVVGKDLAEACAFFFNFFALKHFTFRRSRTA